MRDVSTASAELPAEVTELGARQAGLVKRSQLNQLGLGRDVVAMHVRARRWRLVGDVVVLHRGPLVRAAAQWFSVLHVEGDRAGSAGLASFSALEVAGLRGWSRPEMHVLTSRSSWVRERPGIVIHESRRFRPAVDLIASSGPPRTAVARSAVDAAAWSRSLRTASGVLAAVVQQRLCSASELADALQAAGRVRHVALMRRIIADLGGGADSLAEIDMAALIRRAGLARPRRQVVRRDVSGRRRYIDLEVDLPDGVVLAIEVDGAHHLDPAAWWADQERQNDLVATGALFARFPAALVRTDPDAVVRSLRRIAAAHR